MSNSLLSPSCVVLNSLSPTHNHNLFYSVVEAGLAVSQQGVEVIGQLEALWPGLPVHLAHSFLYPHSAWSSLPAPLLFMLLLPYPLRSPSVFPVRSLYLSRASVLLSSLFQHFLVLSFSQKLSFSPAPPPSFETAKSNFSPFVRAVGGKPLSRDFLVWLECY